jgi:uncharacterized membrane protein YkoI
MKYDHDRLMQAKRTIALVNTCTVPLDQAIAIARSSVGGTVFDVKLKEMDERVVWRMKLLRGGERVKVYVDALAGHIIEAKAEVAVSEHTPG